jgi:hypothetical protein
MITVIMTPSSKLNLVQNALLIQSSMFSRFFFRFQQITVSGEDISLLIRSDN